MPSLFVLPFPHIDPVLVSIGPFAVRWYALAYIAGLLIGWWAILRMAHDEPAPAGRPVRLTRAMVDDFLLWATLGVILGGRLGHVLFYDPAYYFAHPFEILAVWRGGMAFHGGFLGVVVAIVLYCRRRGLSVFALGDPIALVAPIGIFFGRIANFINAELYGRPSDLPWAMVFPTDRFALPRHPSQLYEALLEGALLFAVLYGLYRFKDAMARPGLLTGVFVSGYGIARIVGENFRELEPTIGALPYGVTYGQVLSLPLVAVGAWLIARAAAPQDR